MDLPFPAFGQMITVKALLAWKDSRAYGVGPEYLQVHSVIGQCCELTWHRFCVN